MKIFCISSNVTKHIVGSFAALFNKYWKNQKVTVLGYDKLKYNLPHNFEFISLGHEPPNKYWTNELIPYFQSIKDKYFIVILDDFFITNYVNNEKIENLFTTMKKVNADKAMLHLCLNKPQDQEIEKGIIQISSDREYKTTLHPAIWKKDLFMYYLKPNLTNYEFESQNNFGKDDNIKVISVKEKSNEENHIVCCINYFRGGKQNGGSDGISMLLHKEDIEIINKNLRR